MRVTGRTKHKLASRWLLRHARSARGWIGLAVALGFGSGVLLIGQAWLLAEIIHSALFENTPRMLLLSQFTMLGAIIGLRALMGWGREVAGFWAGAKIREDIRMALLGHMVQLGPGYTASMQTGALSSAAMEQIEGLHDFFAHYLPQLALAVMIPVAILIGVFPLTWAAAGLLLATAPLIPLFMVLVGMGAESISQKQHQALARLSAHFLDVLQGLTTLKLFNRSKDEADHLHATSHDFRKRTMRVLRVAFLSSAVLEFFSSIAIALVAVYLAMNFLGYVNFGDYGNNLTLAHGLFILLLAPEFYLPLRELGTHYHARADALGAAKEILKILAIAPQHQEGDTAQWPHNGPMTLRAENLQIAFDRGKRPALRGVSFELKQGQHIAVVGTSGSGKTTLLNLVLGFLTPDKGGLAVNDTPFKTLSMDTWREQISWIGQSPVLFHGTIRSNILLAKPDASETALEAAATAARVTEFMEQLPQGLDTPVGEQGLGLSRGQAQRVALARAFLKNAPFLLLDEPTAGLDSENADLVMQAIQTLSQGKGILWVTHRLAYAAHADLTLVLEQGRVAEQGTFDELYAQKGLFHHMTARDEG